MQVCFTYRVVDILNWGAKYGFGGVLVKTYWIVSVASRLFGSGVDLSVVMDFSLGSKYSLSGNLVSSIKSHHRLEKLSRAGFQGLGSNRVLGMVGLVLFRGTQTKRGQTFKVSSLSLVMIVGLAANLEKRHLCSVGCCDSTSLQQKFRKV